MRIVELNGGLGNQMCQYVFGRFLEIHFDADVWYDLLYFETTDRHNGFELNKIFKNAKLKYINQLFDKDVWSNMVKIHVDSDAALKLPNILLDNGMDLALVADEYWHDGEAGLRFGYEFKGSVYSVFSILMTSPDSDLYKEFEKHKNIYFMGVWMCGKFIDSIKKEILEEFQFPELQDQQNIDYKEDILAQRISIGLHVRRGDFITVNKLLPNSRYAAAIDDVKSVLIDRNAGSASFYIFSDDIEWCKENFKELGFDENDYLVFIEGNDVDGKNYIDMQLMSYCDYLIHNAESTFCLGAEFASTKGTKRVVMRKRDFT